MLDSSARHVPMLLMREAMCPEKLRKSTTQVVRPLAVLSLYLGATR